ncbi:hypothetical protein H7849_14080 [Alloacidobacterium dinghuense]|uniref:Glycosyltransferase RgtA/B/C/D-like domain-containing protein n=1 Tax=Alloacidobacterium dinghuense TaxID=2763107 RepID=A0A7G8BCN6_9BACT|nr:hypothetical protein [Alloacidobacterium dinghuense]QNI30306.1 hypothetical protein H7849_14080 [Alloacidobacterium dinghuense]
MSSTVLEAQSSTLVLDERISHRPLSLGTREISYLAFLTPLVLLLHGYHPFADDAGIYVAGIRKILDPTLFSVDSSFVVTHTRFSIFSHLFAEVVRFFHVPLKVGLFAAYALSIFAFLLGCFRLSQRAFRDAQLQWGATLLAAALFTLPVAATALWIMDPYVTARSFSTPLSLFALTACIDRDMKRTALWLVATALLHPLMAAYLAGFLVAYGLVSRRWWLGLAAACLASLAASAVIYFATRHASLPDGYKDAVLTRTYFFLAFWHWYEVLGLVIPLTLMLIAAYSTRNLVVRNLCLSCIATGVTASVIVACFVHPSGSYFLARIQPLRTFQIVYIIGVLLLGAFLSEHLRGKRTVWGVALLLVVSVLMFLVQKQVYMASSHVEWPFATPRNPWQQAFLWIRQNTPQNAIFALDSDYTRVDSEDTQGFRASAVRSALVDELKDGGVVAIFPELAPRWKLQRDLELGLDHISDQERVTRLRPAGVTWILLSAGANTRFNCPYRNSTVIVCRLP